jgi:glycosyltransferase involved in cell wall biosynthesis
MRVLMVTEFYPPFRGGLEFHVQSLAKELDQRGHDIHVATLGPSSGQSKDGGVTVHSIRSTASRFPLLYVDPTRPFHLPVPDFEVRRELARLLSRIRPDVIHAHNWMAASLPSSGIPLLLTSHDYAWACPKRTLLRADGSICAGPSVRRCIPCATSQYGNVKAFLVDSTTRIGRRSVRPDVHLAVSGAVAGAIAPFTRLYPSVVPNFVPSDLALLPDVPVPGLPAGDFALFAGAGSPHKGIDVLLEAWGADSVPCPLVIATTRPVDRRLPSGVAQTSLTRDQVISALRRAAVAVVPSIWPDPCPTVVIEAMTLGVPVVASQVGGITELLRDGEEGRLVPPNDPGALRDAVVGILSNAALRAQMGAAGQRRSEQYSLRTVATTIEQIYEGAVSHSKISA